MNCNHVTHLPVGAEQRVAGPQRSLGTKTYAEDVLATWFVTNRINNIFIFFSFCLAEPRGIVSTTTNLDKAVIYPKGLGAATIVSIDLTDISWPNRFYVGRFGYVFQFNESWHKIGCGWVKISIFGMTFFWIADFSPQVQSTKKWDDLFHYVEQVSLVHKGTSLPTDHFE